MALPAALAFLTPAAFAEEGMWPYDQIPRDELQQKFKFEATPDFFDHLRLSSVRVGGGSGAFVSPQGLILTSRQAVAGCLASLPGGASEAGFYAAEAPSEARCSGLDAEILLRIENVTAKVAAGSKETGARAVAARNQNISRIEKSCAPGHRCVVVKLFSGGRYDLYEYRVYNDLRLVFAPEYDLAFFGKERDSITYLRYGLNVAFLRAWENGKPAATPQFLKVNPAAVHEGDLVIAAANPQPTGRASTAAQLQFDRDRALPLAVSRLESRITKLSVFSSQSDSNKRAAEATLAAFLAQYKIDAGRLIGLRDDRLVTRKTVFEDKIRRAVQASKLGNDAGKVWDDLAAAYKQWTPFERPYQILEASPAPGSNLFRQARREIRKENADASAAAVPEPVEIILLTAYLEELKSLGDKEVPLKNVLGGKSPQEAAESLVKTGTVKQLAEALEDSARRLAKKHDEILGALETSASEKIAQYRFKLFGNADYPDATGTPRVEFGAVKGYTDRAGIAMPFVSTFSGLYFREENSGPYLVPQRWLDLRASLQQTTGLDFVSTCDVGGGDFGAPTVNRAGELAGVLFDGNLESLPGTYLYSDEQARAVHVAASGIAESLRVIYKASALLRELGLPVD